MKRETFRRGVASLAVATLLVVVAASCKKEEPVKVDAPKPGQPASTANRQVHKAPDGAPLKLAFVSNNPDPFWKIAEAGLIKFEKETGLHVDFKQPNGKVEDQNKIIESLLSQGYHGIAVSVIAPDAQTSVINKAAAKTNVVTHDSDAPGSDRLAYIGTNNYEAGKRLGHEIAKLLPDGGKVAVFVGMMSADNAQQRYRGIKDAVGPKIEVLQPKEDNKNAVAMRTNVESVLNSQPDVKLLCGLWADNGPAIADAIKSKGKTGQIKAAVFDEADGTLKGIEEGVIACTVVQKPYQFGYQSAKLLQALATQGESALPKDPIIDTGVEVITAGPTVPGQTRNVTEFATELAKMKAP